MNSQPNKNTPAPVPEYIPEGLDDYTVAKQKKANMIRKMLWLGYQMGWDQPTSPVEKVLTKQQLCWNHVEKWCKSTHCAIRKGLNRYTPEELAQVVTQFELVYESFKKQLKQQEP